MDFTYTVSISISDEDLAAMDALEQGSPEWWEALDFLHEGEEGWSQFVDAFRKADKQRGL